MWGGERERGRERERERGRARVGMQGSAVKVSLCCASLLFHPHPRAHGPHLNTRHAANTTPTHRQARPTLHTHTPATQANKADFTHTHTHTHTHLCLGINLTREAINLAVTLLELLEEAGEASILVRCRLSQLFFHNRKVLPHARVAFLQLRHCLLQARKPFAWSPHWRKGVCARGVGEAFVLCVCMCVWGGSGFGVWGLWFRV